MTGSSHTLSLRSNTHAAIICLLILALALVFAAIVYTTRANVVISEMRAADGQAKRLAQTTHHELDSLAALTSDWASRDATWRFMTGADAGLVDQNLTAEQFERIDVQAVLLLDGSGTPVMSWQSAEVPKELSERIMAWPVSDSEGFVCNSGTAMMVSAQPITGPSGESAGTLVFCRRFEPAPVAALAGVEGDRPPSVISLDTARKQMFPSLNLSKAHPSGVKLTRPHTLTLYTLLLDPTGRAAGVLRAPVDSVGYKGTPQLVSGIVVALMVVGAVWATLTVGLVERFSLSRISWLRACVNALGDEQDDSMRLIVDGEYVRDEIDGVARDINVMLDRLEDAREAERQSDLFCAALIDNMVDAVFVLSTDGHVVFASHQATALTGRTASDLLGEHYSEVFSADSDSELETLLDKGLAPGTSDIFEAVVLHCDRRRIPVELAVSQFIDDERVDAIQVIARDITERKRFEAQLIRLADHDHLTGLFNRKRFEEELVRELAECSRQQTSGALLWLDLDGFKEINDVFGHRAGDRVLITLAEILRKVCRTEQPVGRLGGDEFAILIPRCTFSEAGVAASRVLEAIRSAEIVHETNVLHITASLGIALFPQDGQTVAELLSHADIAMYQAKQSGLNHIRRYELDKGLDRTVTEKHAWAGRLEHALQEDRLVAFCQPVIDLKDGSTTRYELLVRISENDEIIEPAQFLPHAENLALVNDIDRWMIGEAISIARLRLAEGVPVGLAINLSGHAFADPEFLKYIYEYAIANPDIAAYLSFEITETALIRHMATAVSFVRQIQEAGCTVCLDDFGSGFSSFYYLRHLPVRVIKIDRELISNVAADEKTRHLVKAIADLAHGLGMVTVAEGVEDYETMHLIDGLGIDLVQGYYVGRPEPARCALTSSIFTEIVDV